MLFTYFPLRNIYRPNRAKADHCLTSVGDNISWSGKSDQKRQTDEAGIVT